MELLVFFTFWHLLIDFPLQDLILIRFGKYEEVLGLSEEVSAKWTENAPNYLHVSLKIIAIKSNPNNFFA